MFVVDKDVLLSFSIFLIEACSHYAILCLLASTQQQISKKNFFFQCCKEAADSFHFGDDGTD